MKLLLPIAVLVVVDVSLAFPNKRWHTQGNVVNNIVGFQVHPTFCRGLKCPGYEKLADKGAYEIRRYNRTNWISSDYNTGGNSSTFRNLFRYISGNNERGETIPMTLPVLIKVRPGDQNQNDRKAMLFYVAQSDAPEPSDRQVELHQIGPMTVYVRTHSGYTWRGQTLANQKKALQEALERDGLSDTYEPYFYTAGYSKRMSPINRHSEIWFIKKSHSEQSNVAETA